MTIWQHALLATVGFVGVVAHAQPLSVAVERSDDALQVQADWDMTRLQPIGVPLSITLSRMLRASDGRLAVIVGSSDVSAIVQQLGRRVRFMQHGVRLDAAREHDVEVYLVDRRHRSYRSFSRRDPLPVPDC